jgi:hypothetical protein
MAACVHWTLQLILLVSGVVSYARKMFMESTTGTNKSTQTSSRGGMSLQTMHHQEKNSIKLFFFIDAIVMYAFASNP